IKKTHGAKCGINVAQFTSVAPAIAATNREMVEGGQSPSATPPSAPTSTLEEETAKTGQPPRKGSVSKSPDAAKKTGTMNPPSLASKKGSVTNSATVGKTGQSPGIESTTTGVKRRASKDNFEGTAASPAKRRKSRAE
ncbi:MAG: hypothetical protein M1833_002310, partial [Piccolia ochrophora]